jgi:hypothetical protein
MLAATYAPEKTGMLRRFVKLTAPEPQDALAVQNFYSVSSGR